MVKVLKNYPVQIGYNSVLFETKEGVFFLENVEMIKDIDSMAILPMKKIVLPNGKRLLRGFYHLGSNSSNMFLLSKSNKVFLYGGGSPYDSFAHVKVFDSFAHVKVVNIFCGYMHTIFLSNENDLYGAGTCSRGELGKTGRGESSLATPVKLLKETIPPRQKIVGGSAGSYFSVILLSNGTAYSTGCNTDGRLGVGHRQRTQVFTKVILPKKIKKVSCGWHHTVYLTYQNEAYSCGWNNNGRCGCKKSTSYVLVPEKVLVDKVVDIRSGFHHSSFLNDKGEVFVSINFNRHGSDYTPNKIITNRSFIYTTVHRNHLFLVDLNGRLFVKESKKAGIMELKIPNLVLDVECDDNVSRFRTMLNTNTKYVDVIFT